jgi:hypothetical protein
MVIACDHVLRAEVDVGTDVRPGRAQQKLLIIAGDTVRLRHAADEKNREAGESLKDAP